MSGVETKPCFSPDLEQALAAFSSSPEASIDTLRNAILEEIEDAVDYHLAEEAMERIRDGTDKTIPLEQLRAELGLDESRQPLKIVDASGLKCPLPVLLARRALKTHECIDLITTDPASVIDVPVFCSQMGYEAMSIARRDKWEWLIFNDTGHSRESGNQVVVQIPDDRNV